MNSKSSKKVKNDMVMIGGSVLKPNSTRAMLEGHFYVTKVINVEKVP